MEAERGLRRQGGITRRLPLFMAQLVGSLIQDRRRLAVHRLLARIGLGVGALSPIPRPFAKVSDDDSVCHAARLAGCGPPAHLPRLTAAATGGVAAPAFLVIRQIGEAPFSAGTMHILFLDCFEIPACSKVLAG
ncbi:MAG: hypothetical protein ACM3JG_11260 [Thiohalocapsa sp.]